MKVWLVFLLVLYYNNLIFCEVLKDNYAILLPNKIQSREYWLELAKYYVRIHKPYKVKKYEPFRPLNKTTTGFTPTISTSGSDIEWESNTAEDPIVEETSEITVDKANTFGSSIQTTTLLMSIIGKAPGIESTTLYSTESSGNEQFTSTTENPFTTTTSQPDPETTTNVIDSTTEYHKTTTSFVDRNTDPTRTTTEFWDTSTEFPITPPTNILFETSTSYQRETSTEFVGGTTELPLFTTKTSPPVPDTTTNIIDSTTEYYKTTTSSIERTTDNARTTTELWDSSTVQPTPIDIYIETSTSTQRETTTVLGDVTTQPPLSTTTSELEDPTTQTLPFLTNFNPSAAETTTSATTLIQTSTPTFNEIENIIETGEEITTETKPTTVKNAILIGDIIQPKPRKLTYSSDVMPETDWY